MNIKEVLVEAEQILKNIDSNIDGLETDGHIRATHNITDLVLQWNLLVQNFVSGGIQDYIELE